MCVTNNESLCLRFESASLQRRGPSYIFSPPHFLIKTKKISVFFRSCQGPQVTKLYESNSCCGPLPQTKGRDRLEADTPFRGGCKERGPWRNQPLLHEATSICCFGQRWLNEPRISNGTLVWQKRGGNTKKRLCAYNQPYYD